MANLQLTKVPMTKTGMLIRKPVAEVFEVVINPDITTKFWFTKSSDRLEAGKQIQWAWEMYDASARTSALSASGRDTAAPPSREFYGVA